MIAYSYHCVLCDQWFSGDDKLTLCPNSETNSHKLTVSAAEVSPKWQGGERIQRKGKVLMWRGVPVLLGR